ncbi:MAG: ComF family protein [Bacteroidales bacterium]|nr:ComF family protein [Bacteroidales bacterium]
MYVRQWLFDITGFFFPLYCPVCGNILCHPGEVICLACELKMPRTNFVKDPENPVAQLFWGRTKLEGATSLMRFEKGSKYQSLIHGLKYRGEKRIGLFLGKLIGKELLPTSFSDVDFIVPVPLHPKKEKKRGFNQSEVIASGIYEITGIPVRNNILFRKQHTETQTHKNRYQRWENMDGVFEISNENGVLHNKKILLVDDVVTTGSTLEACAETLHRSGPSAIYIATIACA